MGKKFKESDAPQVIVVRLSGGREKHLWRALKVLAKYFDTKPTLVSVQAVAEFWGYELGIVPGFYYAVQIDSVMDELLAMDPEVWGAMVEAESDPAVVRVVS